MTFPEKLRLIRKAHNMTQADFASSIGISRGNLANIERGNVSPTPLFVNCVSLMYHVDKEWLLDEQDDDLSALSGYGGMLSLIMEKYERLEPGYKKFVENQINELLEMQRTGEEKPR